MAPTPSTSLKNYTPITKSDPVLASIEKFMYECENMTNDNMFVSKGKIYDSDADLLKVLGPDNTTTNRSTKLMSTKTCPKVIVTPFKLKVDSSLKSENAKKKTFESDIKKKSEIRKRGRPRKNRIELLELKSAHIDKTPQFFECKPMYHQLKKAKHVVPTYQRAGACLVPVICQHKIESFPDKCIDLTNDDEELVEITSEKQCINEILSILYNSYSICDTTNRMVEAAGQTFTCMPLEEKVLFANYKAMKIAKWRRSLVEVLARMAIRNFCLERFADIICQKLDEIYKVKLTQEFVCNDLLFCLLDPDITECRNQLLKDIVKQLTVYTVSKNIKPEECIEAFNNDVGITESQMEQLRLQIQMFNQLFPVNPNTERTTGTTREIKQELEG